MSPKVLALLMVCLGVVALSGCLAPIDAVRDRVPHGGEVYLLDIRVEILAPFPGDPQATTLGGHCGDAYKEDGAWQLERGALERAGDDPWLIVDPAYSSHSNGSWHGWSTSGDAPEIEGLPYATGPGTRYVMDEGSVSLRPFVVDLEQAANGTLLLFGAPVSLPHVWNITDPEGRWSAEMTLRDGPDRHYRWTMYGCE